MPFPTDTQQLTPEKQFIRDAQPHSWVLVADSLHSQAVALYSRRGQSGISMIGEDGETLGSWDAVNRSVFLLAGFALENSIKAFLVYENPSWISNGRLSKHLKSHQLEVLASRSGLLPYPNRGRWILRSFGDGLESWARYPCALIAAKGPMREQVLSERLWNGYIRLMRTYGKRLKALMEKQWEGPHGFSCSIKFTREMFDW